MSADEVLCRYANNCSDYGLWNDTETLGAGYHYYTVRASGGENYTTSSLLLPLLIEKKKPTLIRSNNTAEVNTSGLVGYWKFDEGLDNTTYDKSGYENNGTLNENNTWAAGRFGQSVNFNGSDGEVEISTTDLNLTKFTEDEGLSISMWVKPFLNYTWLISRDTGSGDGFRAYINNDTGNYDTVSVVWENSTNDAQYVTSSNKLNMSEWNFIAIIINNTHFRIDVNGITTTNTQS